MGEGERIQPPSQVYILSWLVSWKTF